MTATPDRSSINPAGKDELDRRLDAAAGYLVADSQLSAARFAVHQEHVMSLINQTPTEDDTSAVAGHKRGRGSVVRAWQGMSRSRRRLVVAAAGMLAVGAAATGPAAADQVAFWVQPNGVQMVEVGALRVSYQDKVYTWAQIDDLQARGKAQVTVMDAGSARDHGLAHAFDTEREADAWACDNLPQLATRPICTGR